jgi:hypothetical protein
MATSLDVYTHASVTAQRDAVKLVEDRLVPDVLKSENGEKTAQEETQLVQRVSGRGVEI